MDTLNLAGASDANPLPKWLAPAGGLFIGVAVSALFCGLPPRHFVSWGSLINSASWRVLVVFLASAATVWALQRIRPDTATAQHLTLRTSLNALWLAPLALFLCEKSLWALPLAALFLARVTQSFHALQDRSNTADDGLILSLTGNTLGMPDSSLQFRRLCSACAATLFAEVGVIAGFIGYPFVAAAMVGISSAVSTWFAVEAHARSQQTRSSASSPSRVMVALVLAIVLTAVGLTRYLAHARHWGILGTLSATNSHHGLSPAERQPQVGRDKTPAGAASELAEAYSGVVLWPKKQTYTALVVSPPLLSNNNPFNSGRSSNPLVIPFNGVYWFFRLPDTRPPTGSREVFGTPDRFDTHSNDQRPLSMEAHQHLGTLIDLDCCSRIQVAIRNADRYPGTVNLELILTNTSLTGKPHQSLGKLIVRSSLNWQLYDNRPPVAETLSFEIPPHTVIRRFDELTIVFGMDANRAEYAAKIAIERFVIVPRGL